MFDWSVRGRFDGHKDVIQSVAFAADGHRALSGSADKTIRLWDVAAGKELQRLEGHEDGIRSVALESTGIYWISLYEVLEQYGFEIRVVNARHVSMCQSEPRPTS